MTVRVEYKEMQLAKVKVSPSVEPNRTDPTIQSIAKISLNRFPKDEWDWNELISISIIREGKEFLLFYRLEELFNKEKEKEVND